MLTTRCGPTVPALQWPLVGSTGVAIDLAVSELKSTDPFVAGAKVGGVQPGASWRMSSLGLPAVVVWLALGPKADNLSTESSSLDVDRGDQFCM